MNIAIIVPSPVPYQRGGVENLIDGFLNYGQKYTNDNIEVIAIDCLEDSFWNLIESYNKFFHLDVSKYCLVISTKYPSWMVNHPNHVCYYLHPLRGLYDTYSHLNLDLTVKTFPVILSPIFNIIRGNIYSRDLFQEVYSQLKKHKQEIEAHQLASFPGVFLREIIHFFDKCGYQNVSKMYCQSATVQNRQDYFLKTKKPLEIIYPAPLLDNYFCQDFDYFFTVSRLDSAKRIDLIIKSFKESSTKKKLLIAGTGSCEIELKALANSDPRIKFLGFVDNQKLLSLYANCLAVIFTPNDEDYGYVTIEAMKSKKAVITLVDSGGVLEFVENNITGLICTNKTLAKNIDYMSSNPDKAITMGQNGFNKVKNISWETAYNKLVQPTLPRKSILVVNTYHIYPPRGGGQIREYNLYKRLAANFNINYLSVVSIDLNSNQTSLGHNFNEILIRENQLQADMRFALQNKYKELIFDVLNIENISLNEEYIEKFQLLQKTADIIIFSHPYMVKLYDLIEDRTKKTCIYESHNIEYKLKESIFKHNPNCNNMINDIYEAEKRLCNNADYILTVSKEDKEIYKKEYNINDSNIVVIPNGVDTNIYKMITQEDYMEARRSAGIPKDLKVCSFLGSWHKPNLEAFEFILTLAKAQPDCIFFVIGSVYDYYIYNGGKEQSIPKNVKCFREVNDFIKLKLLQCSDLALNPVFSGSGTNLKIFEYLSLGLPTISTNFGARGINASNQNNIFLANNLNEFLNTIKTTPLNFKSDQTLKINGSKYIKQNFDWDQIAKKMTQTIIDIS
jgi:glycosyltransferase involved in cell wall biosynthesis